MTRLHEEGGAVCFATQNVEEVGQHADRVLVLQGGRVAYAGAPAGYAEAAEEAFR